MSLHVATPFLASHALSLSSGHSVWLKLEALQPSGSFKMRGVGHACEIWRDRGARRFVSSSGGNAGLAVAHAGRMLGLPVMVVVPESTPARALTLLRREGADVVVHGETWQEAHRHALDRVGDADAFIHPFDDPLLWHGHATLVDEMARTGVKPDIVVLAVGGGGLLCGVIEGLHRNGWHDVPVLAVETLGTASFHAALQEGHAVQLEGISGVATSLGAKRVCDQAVAWSREHAIESVLVSDRSALDACMRFLDDHRLLVEPACGAGLAPLYETMPVLDRYKTVAVVVCGGATCTVEQLQQQRARCDAPD